MKGTDVIRAVLDLIDQIDDDKIDMDVSVAVPADSPHSVGVEDSRFRQIVAMLDKMKPFPGTGVTTEPNEVVADIDAVTTGAGGGVNGPKHPADIRVKDPRGY